MMFLDGDPRKHLKEMLKAQLDPVYFCESPHFLNIKLFPKSKELIRKFYEGGYNEFILVAGMRSGKTTLLSCFAAYETFLVLTIDYRRKYDLLPGSPIFGIMAAAKEEQARDTIFAAYKARIEHSPFFNSLDFYVRRDFVVFPEHNFMVRAVCSSSATEVGRTCKFVCIDEMSRLEETAGKRSGLEVYRALTKSTRTFLDEGHRFICGSPQHTTDLLMQLYEQGKKNPKTLVAKYATWEYNPHISRESLADEFQRDPLAAMRDYGADPTSALDVFFRDKSILNYSGRNVLMALWDNAPVQPEPFDYVLAGDPALRHDAFGLALAHREGDTYIVDGVFRFKPTRKKEVDPFEVKDFILKIIDRFPVRAVVFDTWNFPEIQREISRRGVKVVNHIVRRPEYDRLKELAWDRKLILPDADYLRFELESLIITPSGKVDHPKGGSKDVADAVANAIWLLSTFEKPKRVALGLVEVV